MNRYIGNNRSGRPPRPKGKRNDSRPARPKATPKPNAARPGSFQIIERAGQGTGEENRRGGEDFINHQPGRSPGGKDTTLHSPFRVLIAVHRPRFRGRTERATALAGWEVTALLNKQDPVGLCAKPPRPPDLLILSGDFGRQKDLAIFRAVQKYRQQGMRIVGLVDDCQTAPEGFPDSVPTDLCDACLEPPYKTADLRTLFAELYEEMRGRPAPPPISKAATKEDRLEEEEEE